MALKNHIENIAIVGAGGSMGGFITQELLKQGKHKLTAVTRLDSKSVIPNGLAVKKVNYDDKAALVEALKGQDALIITMSATAPPDSQTKILEAAAEAGISWVLPNEWGTDDANKQLNQENFIGVPKQALRDKIGELGGISWIGIACGFWYEFSMAVGHEGLGFNLKDKTLLFYDDGNTKLSLSSWPLTGKAVAKVLALPIKSEDGKSPCLNDYRNKFVVVRSFHVSQREMFDSVLRVTGDKESDWKITETPVQPFFKNAVEQIQKTGDRKYFAQLLYSRSFFPNSDHGLENGYDNEKLGLPEFEDLDQYTKVAVQMVKDGYKYR